MRYKFAALLLGTLAGLADGALPAPGHAQRVAEVRVMPRIGFMTPADWFYEEFQHFGIDPLEWTNGAVQASVIAGITVQAGLWNDGLWLRGEVLRTIGSETSVTHAILYGPAGFNPPQVVRTRYVVRSTITSASLDIALPTRLRLPGGVQPYVAAGAGLRHYEFDTTPLANLEDTLVLPRNGTVALVNIGAGLSVDVAGLRLGLNARDAISEYWGNRQHDFTILFGAAFSVF